MTQSAETRVLYNAQCPVCRREIEHYAGYTERLSLPVRYEDLNDASLKDWGVTADQAARRLHVIEDGQVLDGIPAFIALWRRMPRYRWLARLVSLPGINMLAVKTYDYLLAPLLYAMHRRRIARQCSL